MLIWMWLLGCSSGEIDEVRTRDPLWAMPSDSLLDEDGYVALPSQLLPQPIGGTAIPVERLTWRMGFSPVQTTVFFPTEVLDADSLPGVEEAAEAGSGQIWDLTSGQRVPCLAELDLFPQEEEIPTLLKIDFSDFVFSPNEYSVSDDLFPLESCFAKGSCTLI